MKPSECSPTSERAEQPAASRRVLLVSPQSPYPPDFGGAQRTSHLLHALAQHCHVDLYLLVPPPENDRCVLIRNHRMIGWFKGPSALLLRLRRRMIAAVSGPAARAMADARKAAAVAETVIRGQYDTIVLRYSETACQLYRLRRLLPDTVILVDTDDLLAALVKESDVIGRESNILRRVAYSLTNKSALRRERCVLREADGLWYTGEVPEWIKHQGGTCLELPNIPWTWTQDEQSGAPRTSGSVDIIGVARFTYSPNFEGFDWFLSNVWPLIRQGLPHGKLRLIGRPPAEPHLTRWKNIPGVEILGTVPNVRLDYRSANISIAPIFSGGGTKIKVLEALYYGLPCVCSVHAAKGFNNIPIQVTNDAAEFAELCLKLLKNPDLRERQSAEGSVAIARYYSFSIFSSNVRDLLHKTNRSRITSNALNGIAE